MEDQFEDLKTAEDFAGLEAPTPDATDFRIAPATEPPKAPRGEVHRERQRLGAIHQWQVRDRRDGVPLPARSSKAPPPSKRSAIEALLLKQRAAQPHIKKTLEEYVLLTVQDLGGWEHLSAGQRAMLLAQRVALLVIL